MENLHALAVPSGPTNGVTTNGAGPMNFAELQRRKSNLEQELEALSGVLESQGVNMETPLITSDGFPRSDIDVAKIRTTRARIIRLKNDYKDLMAKLEQHVHELFASIGYDTDEDHENGIINGQATSTSSGVGSVPSSIPSSGVRGAYQPFAKINSVVRDSPADEAGLQQGDEIRNFGYINGSNHENLTKVAECVQENEGRAIFITVLRPMDAARRQEMNLTITPTRDWGGRGMLGCHIVPL
ncbi:hypothetical protein E4U31_003210 [Claviceps sp. LM219 group G6]|nr:hypothetical protein E4U15_000465 [Claviceps sp. LM218 group G6]KAG6102953.1 hypothetical protein E4U31_003210 [Claviceps sp. LM219 group G6]